MQLIHKDQTFKWESKYKKAFQNIKILFTNESTLQSHDSEKKLTVEILRDENIVQAYDPQKKQTMETDVSQ